MWFTSTEDINRLYDMVTIDAARCINLKNFELKPGGAANLVILGQNDVVEALRFHAAPDYVISQGKLVDPEKMKAIGLAELC